MTGEVSMVGEYPLFAKTLQTEQEHDGRQKGARRCGGWWARAYIPSLGMRAAAAIQRAGSAAGAAHSSVSQLILSSPLSAGAGRGL